MKKKVMKKVLGSLFLFAGLTALSACGEASVEGVWVEPVPGMEGEVQGFNLSEGGKAASVNMATLQYNGWEKVGNRLILSGNSIGNGQTISFRDTFLIEKISGDSLVLKDRNLRRAYKSMR